MQHDKMALYKHCAVPHLRKEHLAGAEEVAHNIHTVHQGPFNDLERLWIQP